MNNPEYLDWKTANRAASMGGEYRILPVSAINVDHQRYQRDLRQGDIDRLVANWDDDKLLPLLVNRRDDGTYWTFDGQHRRAAAIARGIRALPCLVWAGLAVEREAALFAYFNSRESGRPVGFREQFRARVEANDEEAAAIMRAVHRAGFEIEYHLAGGKSEHIAAVGACQAVYRRVGEDGLFRALDLLNRAWPENRERVQEHFIQGAAQFIALYGDKIGAREWERLIARLAAQPIGQVLVRARDRNRVHHEKMRDAIALVFAQIHDKRAAADRRLLGSR